MSEMLSEITRKISVTYPGLEFSLQLQSTRSAPAALIAGESLLAPMGAEMNKEQIASLLAATGHLPVLFRVAHDSLTPGTLSSPAGVLVSSKNPIRSVKLSDLRRVFVTSNEKPFGNWGQLGLTGPRALRPIHPVGLEADTAIGHSILVGPMHAQQYVANLDGKRQSRDVAAAVANDVDAIGIANLNHAGIGTRALVIVDDDGKKHQPVRAEIEAGRYPLDRYLLIYARRERNGKIDPLARLLLHAILSRSGQATISAGKRGYIPLNPQERAVELRKLRS